EVEGSDVTRGQDLIQHVRQLGQETAWAIEQVLTAPEGPAAPGPTPPLDPFIDPAEEAATRYYLTQVNRALAQREASLEDLPDPAARRRGGRLFGKRGGPAGRAARVPPGARAMTPKANRRETTPRREPVTVPEKVPVRPQPARPAPQPARPATPRPQP